jgi:hypothetical protein
MIVCKFYVDGKCNNKNCRYKHVDNICKQYFFNKSCSNINCIYDHSYTINNNNNNNNYKKKNTETFVPNYNEPDMRVLYNKMITKSNEVAIFPEFFKDNSDNHIFKNLLNEIDNNIFKRWHGDTHLIADDSYNWKLSAPAFAHIIDTIGWKCSTEISATRFNYYPNNDDWKPYHHDAAAIKEDKKETQNVTIGISFGDTREISFESAKQNNKNLRNIVNFPLDTGTLYVFGNEINSNWRHGIPPIKNLDTNSNNGRISIIIWGKCILF